MNNSSVDMQGVLNFLSDLKCNNNREWFNDNKLRYLAIKEYIESLTSELISQLSTIDARASQLRPVDCLYRIYRDTRFSANKEPYKTHIGIFINPPQGKKSLTFGHYLHIEPGESFFAAGNIGLPPEILRAVRQSIYYGINDYKAIVEDPAFKTLFPELGMDLLKTAPKGFDPHWPDIKYLRPRNFTASSEIFPDDFLTAADLQKRLLPYMQQADRFNRFINETVEDYI